MENIESARLIGRSIISLAMVATALGEGYLVGKGLEAMGRNPQAADSIFTKMIIGVAMTESTAIYALVMFFVL